MGLIALEKHAEGTDPQGVCDARPPDAEKYDVQTTLTRHSRYFSGNYQHRQITGTLNSAHCATPAGCQAPASEHTTENSSTDPPN